MAQRRTVLGILESRLSATSADVAEELEVSQRTVATRVGEINQALGGAAEIVQVDGALRLEILDPAEFQRRRQVLVAERGELNDPVARQGAMLREIAFRGVPVTAEELAGKLCVSRSTVHADLARLRKAIEPYGLEAQGRPNAGIELVGTEMQVRLAFVEKFSRVLHATAAVPDGAIAEVVDIADGIGLGVAAIESVNTWFTVMFERLRLGFPLENVDRVLDTLEHNGALQYGEQLAAIAAAHLGLQPSHAEALFMTLPLVGMRGPREAMALTSLLAPDRNQELYDAIMERIRAEMGIDLKATQLREEFLAHLGFLFNRVKYGIQVTTGSTALLRDRYPLAHEMAVRAGQEIAEVTGHDVTEAEESLLAAYFQVFVNRARTSTDRPLRAVVVCVHGTAEGELLRLQVEDSMGSCGTVRAIAEEEAIGADPSEIDLIVADHHSELTGAPVPVLRVGTVFDTAELRRKVAALAMARGWARGAALGAASWLGTLLEPRGFVRLDSEGYPEALEELLGALHDRALIDGELVEAVRERESRSTMRLFPRVAFPHVSSPEISAPLLAVGISGAGQGLIIVLLVAPEDGEGEASAVLLGVYEELITLAQDEDAVSTIIAAESAARFRTSMAIAAIEMHKEQ